MLRTFRRGNLEQNLLPVNGAPVFLNNGGSFQFFAVFDNTCGSNCDVRVIDATTSEWIQNVLRGEVNEETVRPLQAAATFPAEAPIFTPDCPDAPWTSRVWQSWQGLVISIGVPIGTWLIGALMGCGGGYACGKRAPITPIRPYEMKTM